MKSRRRYRRSSGVLACFLGCAIWAGAAEKTLEDVYLPPLQSGSIEESQKLSERVMKTDRALALAMQVRVLRLKGRPERGLALLEQSGSAYQGEAEVRLERGQCLLSLGRKDEAEQAFGLMRQDKRIPLRCRAVYGLAWLEFASERTEACVADCDRVIEDANGLGDSEVDEGLKKIVEAARKLRDEVRRKRESGIYPQDYIHYKNARLLQAQGQYEQAAQTYQRIRSPMLVDAAGCYAPVCLFRSGKTAEAVAALQAFVKSKPTGLYRGEAWYELGRMLYVLGQLQAAEKALKVAMDWPGKLDGQEGSSTPEQLARVLRDFPLPPNVKDKDAVGNVIQRYAGPEHIVNHVTCRWYLPWLEAQIQLASIFVLGEQRNTAAGLALLKKLMDQDPESTPSKGSAYRVKQGLREGSHVLPLAIWKALDGEDGRLLRLAFFAYGAGDHRQAEDLFAWAKMSLGENKKAPELLVSALELGLGCLEFDARRMDVALSHYEAAAKSANPELSALAIYLQANVHAGRLGEYEKASELYKKAALGEPASEIAPKAWLAWAITAVHHEHPEDALKLCAELARRHGGSLQAGAAAVLKKALGQSRNVLDDAADDPHKVAVFQEVRRHLVFPGGGFEVVPLEKYRASDLLLYKLTYSTRPSCVVVRSFTWCLTEMEPQNPPVNDKKLNFIRALALLSDS